MSGETGEARSTPPAPTLVFAFEVRADVGPPLEIGRGARGLRRIVPILGGTFEGPTIKGRVLPGADWQIIGAVGLERVTRIETDGGQTISVQNSGIRHAEPAVMEKLLRG